MDYMSMLATRKPTSLHRLIETVPPPPYSVPRGGLPAWASIPLDRQIPYVRIPDSIIYFAKNKLGAKLYAQPPGSEFDTWPGTAPEYDPLHDPHLKSFLRRCRSLRLPAEPPCSLAQFNEHRRLLHKIRAKMIKMEMQRQDEMASDALLFKKVEEERDKRRQRFFREEKAKESMRRLMEAQEEERREKARELRQRQKNIENRIKLVQEMKEERKREVARKAHARQELIRQRVEASKEIAMMKKVKNLKRMRLEDIKMKRSLQQARDDRIRKRQEEDATRWNNLWSSQQERMRLREESLRAYTDALRNRVNADLREKKSTQAWRDEELRVIQLTNMKPWADKERDYARDLRHKLAAQWRDKIPKPKLRRQLKPYPSRGRLREAVHSGVNGRSDSQTTMDRSTVWFDKWEEVPRPVRGVLNNVLERTILESAKTQVANMLKQFYGRCVNIIKQGLVKKTLRGSKAARRKSTPPQNTKGSKKSPKKPVEEEPVGTQTPSEQDLQEDIAQEKEANSLLDKSIVRARRVMTEIITEHVQRGLDPETFTISTIPRAIKEKENVEADAYRLAIYLCHTQVIDIKINSDLVKVVAERIALKALRAVQGISQMETKASDKKK